MRSRSSAKTVWLLLAAGTVGTAAAQGRAKPENLFPAKQGLQWIYTGAAGRFRTEVKGEVTAAVEKDGKTTVRIAWKNPLAPGLPYEETYEITPTEVARAGVEYAPVTLKLDPPLPVIRYPMAVGKWWRWLGTFQSGVNRLKAWASIRVDTIERLKIPAGVFDAYRILLRVSVAADQEIVTTVTTCWYAPEVGLVQQKGDAHSPLGSGIPVEIALHHTVQN